MAVVWMTGFESGAALTDEMSSFTQVSGTQTWNTGTVRGGARSIRCTVINSNSGGGMFFSGAPPTHSFGHFAINVASMPAGGSNQKTIYGRSDTAGQINVRLNSTGTLSVYLFTTLIGTTATALSTGTWYWIGVRVVTGTSVEWLQIDGTDAGVTGTATVSSVGLYIGFFDATGPQAAADSYFDDVILDDAAFLAPSEVATLLPISDNARGANWTGGAGGTTNLFDAVNNTPPVGTATETNTTQIEHSGGANNNYDANMTDYATAGIAAGDTILAIQYHICHGEDIATGTKLLNFSLVSNPTQATGIANFAAGADVGALGTFPTNWRYTDNTIVASPSVTLGTSPVMRVSRPETASRVASVCYMAMDVAYELAAAPPAGGDDSYVFEGGGYYPS